jgi:predicted AAA+ superfamily ATPase
MITKRYLHANISADVKEKMAFIGGPRQVGKTTLAQYIGAHEYEKTLYLNWDNRDDRKRILNVSFAGDAKLVIFDELHKYKQWKNYIKGIFDTYRKTFHIIVTGSARLDLYRRGGDSLMGRYHYFRLHPFSLREAAGATPNITPHREHIFSRNLLEGRRNHASAIP